ncbi:MAG: hypothetical protein U9O82_13835 [Thermodesulfobacteriota bacterium]|nr:hypothetical protein [Thermodesulfobacteriota bacterium]
MKTGWVTLDSGYETTQSEKIIKQSVANLKKHRILITLLHKSYRSGNTVLLSFNDQFLLFDKPPNWSGAHSQVKVVYRDKAKLLNYFPVKVVSTDDDTIKTLCPTEIFQLQRRNLFRVTVPRGTLANFKHKSWTFEKLALLDVSAGGMLIETRQRQGLPVNGIINNISITIPADKSESPTGPEKRSKLTIREGRIICSFFDKRLNRHCYAIQFFPTSVEEETLMKFVRGRELGLLRKGLT